MNRRTFVQTLAAAPAVAALTTAARPANPQHILVAGAGAFGGWTALHLLRKGHRVTLVEAWGPGHARASSGGETRVTRHAYTNRIYAEMVADAIPQHYALGVQTDRQIFHPTGVLFADPTDAFVSVAHKNMTDAGIPHQILSQAEFARMFPAMNPEGLQWATWEPQAGYLMARQGCAAVMEQFQREGGEYRTAQVHPGPISGGEMGAVQLSDGTTVHADRYVFALGPWMGRVFPDVIGNLVKPTRQEVYYFGIPEGDLTYSDERFPVWADMGKPVWYGIPGNEWRGFKIADDTRGPDIDPDTAERLPTPEFLKAARDYLYYRFPGLKGAPLVESRVCQYEQSPDGDLIIDHHPQAQNVVLAGGGSGHGYKLGPAVGRHTAALVLGETPVEPTFRLSRFGSR